MYNRKELEQKFVRELRVLCRKLGIVVTTKLRKNELIDALMAYKAMYYKEEKNEDNEEENISVRVKRLKELNDGME